MTEEKDIKILALTCPSCGGALRVPDGADRAVCEHCKSTVLIVDAAAGKTRVEAAESESPEAAAEVRRMVKAILWIAGIAIIVPTAATLIINIIIGLVSLVLGISLAVTAK
jgi:hypothetical protein